MRTHDGLREKVDAAGTLDEALAALGDEVGSLGVSRFVAGFVSGATRELDGRWRRYRHRAYNFPDGWDEGWHAHNADCPYYHSCFSGRIAFDWASVRGRDDLTDPEQKAWKYLADFGLKEGFTVPVHAPGHFGFITVVGDESERGWARRIALQSERLFFLSHVFHEAVRRRFPDFAAAPEAAQLSTRERECLRWAAAGKTAEETGIILGLSPETVRVYLKRAMRKLGVNSRAQAVAHACREQLFD